MSLKKEFKKAESHIDNIDNKDKKKEVEELDKAIKDKYKTHSDYAKAYKKALGKEKSLFSFINKDGATQEQVDEKSKELSKAYKDMNKKFKAYSKAMNKVNKEKQDVDQFK
ncbi:YkyA family protein [Staphylococcus pasteuri]